MPRASIIQRYMLLSLPLILSVRSFAEEKPSSQEIIELSASIMVRQTTDGKKVDGGVDPLLWWTSRYLLEGPSHARFVRALDVFNALPDAQVDVLPPLHRAVLQRHLWTVFDWFVSSSRHPPTPVDDGLKGKVVAALKKAALSRVQISTLPDPYQTTVIAKRFNPHYDSEKPFKPYLPTDLFAEDGSWICINSDFEGAASAQVHGEDQQWRTAFTIFVSLPGGREATRGYLRKLEAFKLPFVSRGGGKVHPKTPKFPKGTRWALVRRALLITNKGEVVSSPLIESVQLRTYHLILARNDPDFPKGSPYMTLGGAAFAELNLNSTQVLTGADPVLRALPEETGKPKPFSTRGHEDPFPDLSKARFHTEGLFDCASCHGGPGIHSVASRNLLFRPRVKVAPIFRPGIPSQSHNFAIKMKTKNPSWKELRGSWGE